KINQMQPDLIIISGRQSDYQEELNKIAPTLYLAVDSSKPWESIQQNVQTLGKIFDREDQAEAGLTDLTKKINEIKEKTSNLDQTALVT
ncbi:ABC transporter substrate-binding protein, partial [Vibrio parahaemolyticus]|nr:ABC transporter substrate-binding protein [Vibrio parahaemolyticus]